MLNVNRRRMQFGKENEKLKFVQVSLIKKLFSSLHFFLSFNYSFCFLNETMQKINWKSFDFFVACNLVEKQCCTIHRDVSFIDVHWSFRMSVHYTAAYLSPNSHFFLAICHILFLSTPTPPSFSLVNWKAFQKAHLEWMMSKVLKLLQKRFEITFLLDINYKA